MADRLIWQISAELTANRKRSLYSCIAWAVPAKITTFVVFLYWLGTASLCSCSANDAVQSSKPKPPSDKLITISDGQTFLSLSPADRGELISLTYGEKGPDLIVPGSSLWSLRLRDGLVHPAQADNFNYNTSADSLTCTWQFDRQNLKVQIRFQPQPEKQGIAMFWSASCRDSNGLYVEDICFPQLTAAGNLDTVTCPYAGTAADFNKADGEYGGLYPGSTAAVQFFAAWDQQLNGLYVGAHDSNGCTKTLLWKNRASSFTFHQPDPQIPRKDFQVPYPIVLAAFKGTWQAGADYYRRWAWQSAPWCRRGTLTETSPAWANDSTVWFYSISDCPLPLQQLAPRLREVFGIKGPIGVHHIEPQVADHSNMPTGQPPQWVLDMKLRQIPIMRNNGYYVFEYRNSHKYTKGFTGYEQAQVYAARWKGKLHEEGPYDGGPDFRCHYVPFGAPGSEPKGVPPDAYAEIPQSKWQKYLLVEMCMGTSYWRQRLLDAVKPGCTYGLVGNYLDQLGYNLNASRCDDPNHGHPLGGGSWYVQSHEKVLRQIIEHYRTNGIEHPLLSHEFFCEPLIGLLNTSLIDEPMQLLSYLYHPYIHFESHSIYGWQQTKDLQALREELSHDFHTGRMPALALGCRLPGVDLTAVLRDNKHPADQPALRMLRHWFSVRAAWLKYLNLGTMLHTPKLEPKSGVISASAWRSPAGDVALFFSNAAPNPQQLIFDLQVCEQQHNWQLYVNDRQLTGHLQQNQKYLQRLLSPDETLVLEALVEKSPCRSK